MLGWPPCLLHYSILITLLFETDDYKEGWNGKYNGEKVTQDVYSYKISYKTISGDDKLYIGKVTLVK